MGNPKCLPQPQYHASSSPKEDQYGVPDSRLPLQQFLPSAMPLKYPNQKPHQNNLPSNSSSRSPRNSSLHPMARVSEKKLRNSPFADLLPAWSQLFVHPIAFFRTFMEVVKMNSDYVTAETMERRKRKVEDVAKRAAYRKAHGLDKDESFGGWTAKSDEQLLGPGIPVGAAEGINGVDGERPQSEPVVREKRPLKKWFGIW